MRSISTRSYMVRTHGSVSFGLIRHFAATKSFIVTMVPETLQNVTKMRKSTVDAFRSTMRAELVPPVLVLVVRGADLLLFCSRMNALQSKSDF